MNKQAEQWDCDGWHKLLQEVLGQMCNETPSLPMVWLWCCTDDSGLQQWAIEHAKSQWSTGIGIIEAAQTVVQEAYDNANIDKYGNLL